MTDSSSGLVSVKKEKEWSPERREPVWEPDLSSVCPLDAVKLEKKPKRVRIKQEMGIVGTSDWSGAPEQRQLATLVDGFYASENYGSVNAQSTQQLRAVIQRLQNYVYSMYTDGEVAATIFGLCAELTDIVEHCNATVTSQQVNMRDLTLNAIIYYTALHEKMTEVNRKLGQAANRDRDAASVFNTVRSDIESVAIDNQNDAVKSVIGDHLTATETVRQSATQQTRSIF
jgi:hypothetical protein